MAAGWRLLSLLLLHLSTPFSSANGAQVSDAFWQGRGVLPALSLSLHFLHLAAAQVGDQPYLWTFQAAAERAQISPNRSFEPAAAQLLLLFVLFYHYLPRVQFA